MLDHDEARRAAEPILSLEGADAVEVLISTSDTGLTRYANSEIIQNTVRLTTTADVRVVAGGDRVAAASTNRIDAAGLRACAEAALQVALSAPPDELFPGLPEPADATPIHRFDEATAAASPAHRAAAIGDILRAAGDASVAGIYETGAHGFSIFNSNGVDLHDAYTRCVVTCLADNGDATGWGDAASHAADGVDVEAAARRALDKAAGGRAAASAEPGAYEVVLEPAAVAAMMEMLPYISMGAKQVLDGESFLATRAGQRVAHEGVTVGDDAFHAGSIGIGFDFEGAPKRPVTVIDRGTARGPVTDLRTAKQLGAEPTGHYSGSNEFGPWASNLVMAAGGASVDEMVSSVDRGLLVTRFHYVNVLDAPETLLTGMTRDGTFLIENGEVTGAVRNMRFTQSVLGILTTARAIGSELHTFVPDYHPFGSFVVPALHVGDFRFDSGTSH